MISQQSMAGRLGATKYRQFKCFDAKFVKIHPEMTSQ
jgi:hypothetical protein